MLKKVMHTILEKKLFAPGDTVVVAVSGGADSVALLDILASLKELNLRLVVAHLNHGLRGAESDGDEAFVRDLAVIYGVTFVTQAVDIMLLSREKKLSLEEAGRVARYKFFDEIAAVCKANVVALAHHADDQAETVLLRLLRGAGGNGLSAMAFKSRFYVRPLLAVSRRDIEAYLRKNSRSFRVDRSNADTNFLRNRIRHELLPLLSSYNPAISERLAATADVLAEDQLLLDRLTVVAASRYLVHGDGEIRLDINGVVSEPLGLRYHLYRRAIEGVKGNLLRISHRHIKEIEALIMSDRPGGKLSLPEGVVVSRRYDTLVFSVHDDANPKVPFEMLLEGPGSYQLPVGVLVVEPAILPAKLAGIPSTVAYIDAESSPFPWTVRSFRPGDRITPLGMTGRKKVKDVFIDEKLPQPRRRLVPLIFSGDRILWVGGFRVAHDARVTAQAKVVMRMEILDLFP